MSSVIENSGRPAGPAGRRGPALRVLSVFGTRPEVIKFAPVIHALENRGIDTINVTSAQHRDLLYPLISFFNLRIDHDLEVMRHGQTLNGVASRVMAALDPILEAEKPDLVLVQGDTTTALAGAMAAWNRGVRVGHIEAGLRSGNRNSPFPEEMNRRLITQLASLHFAATERARQVLLNEGVEETSVFLTGNPVIDALKQTLAKKDLSSRMTDLLGRVESLRLVVLTTHRRENFGDVMGRNLQVMGEFIRRHSDAALVFPVHPNPRVREAVAEHLPASERVHLVEPLDYPDFVQLLSRAWLLVSDSGGVQEEAPTLGKPLLVLRENTERPEAVACGVARLVGGDPELLERELEQTWANPAWEEETRGAVNPYGDGASGERIAAVLEAQAVSV